MALHTQLPIYRIGLELLSLAHRVQEQMPRGIKRTVGEKIAQHCLDILELMALANASREMRAPPSAAPCSNAGTRWKAFTLPKHFA